MQLPKTIKNLVALAACLVACSYALGADEDVPLVNGEIWMESTQENKASYILGMANLLAIENTWQTRDGQPPSDEQTLIQDFWNACEHVTLDEMIAAVDAFYIQRPNERQLAVLNVIWVIYVEPTLNN